MDDEHRIREAAHLLWQTAGENVEKTLDFWLAGERYVRTIALAIGKIAAWPPGFEDTYARLYETISPATYQEQTKGLASVMWDASGRQSDRSLDFWLASERHIGAIMQGAIVRAASPLGAAETLQQTFESFSPHAYLDSVREQAYYLWEAQGRPYGHALDNWLSAEQSTMDAAAGGLTGIFRFALLPPGHPDQEDKPPVRPVGHPS